MNDDASGIHIKTSKNSYLIVYKNFETTLKLYNRIERYIVN